MWADKKTNSKAFCSFNPTVNVRFVVKQQNI